MKRNIITISEDPVLKNLVKDKKVAERLSRKSSTYIDWECPVCKTEKRESPCHIVRRGFNCPTCKDSSSYSERVMRQLLKDNNIIFEEQKKFKDCVDKKELPFDFYIKKDNVEFCIEMQGRQHYENRDTSKWEFNEIQRRDKIKKEYCLSKNIVYVPINAEKSQFQTLLDNIKNSDIGKYIERINMDSMQKAIISNFKDVDTDRLISMHKNGVSFLQMERETGIKRKVIVSILKKLGEYTPRNGLKNNGKAVILLNNLTVFSTATEATDFIGLKEVNNIVANCKGRRKSAGKLGKEKAVWMYYSDYIKEHGEL